MNAPASPRAVDQKSRRYSSEETRALILAAARQLFYERGYVHTSTADIAAAAGVAEGSIFYHFGSKAKLLEELGRDYATQLVGVMRGDAQDLTELEPGLMITRTFAFFADRGHVGKLVGLDEASPEVAPFLAAERAVVVAFIGQVMEANGAHLGREQLAPVDVPIAASLSYAAVRDALHNALNDPERWESYCTEAVRFVRAGCGYTQQGEKRQCPQG